MARNINEKYTESELNQIIYTIFTNKNTRFLLVAKGVENYIFTKIFKQSEITIHEDFITIKKKYSTESKLIEDIILVEKLDEISGY
jgi:hypothetical protein